MQHKPRQNYDSAYASHLSLINSIIRRAIRYIYLIKSIYVR